MIEQGKKETGQAEEEAAEDPLAAVQALIAEGLPKKEALSRIAKQKKIPRRDLYNHCLLYTSRCV